MLCYRLNSSDLPRHTKHALVMIRQALANTQDSLNKEQICALRSAIQRIIDGVTTLDEGMEVSRILTDAGLDYIPDLPNDVEKSDKYE